MILEDATYEAFGYYPSNLTDQSGRQIVSICSECGRLKIAPKHGYRDFCRSCSAILGEVKKGEKHPLFGKHHTKEAKILMREDHYDNTGENNHNYTGGPIKCICKTCGIEFFAIKSRIKRGLATYCSRKCATKGENNPNWNGGKKLAQIRADGKRKKLGCIFLMPLKEGEVGHHFTNEYVIGIPEKVHQKLNGHGRKNHRTKVLQWLKTHDKRKYKMVLCVLAKEPLHIVYEEVIKE